MHPEEIEDLEFDLLLKALQCRRSCDLSDYARASLKRRVAAHVTRLGLKHTVELLNPLLYDDEFFRQFLAHIYVSVTEFFRDPEFLTTLREQVLPYLATFPRPKIWHAGCATGEEVYAMGILLKEAGLLERTKLYGTDVNVKALNTARAGVYPISAFEGAEARYHASGGETQLRDHYIAGENHSKTSNSAPLGLINREIRERITWSQHDLSTEESFTEVHLVVCRNALIYFNRELQDRVVGLLANSLVHRGILALGTKESLAFSAHRDAFTAIELGQRIFRKSGACSRSNAGWVPSKEARES